MITVVTGQSKHIRDAVELAELYFKESPYSRTHKFDKYQTTEFARSVVIKNQFELAVAENEKEESVGFAVGYLTEYGWCADIRVSMEFFYILPAYRGSQAAELLLEHMENWGRSMGAVEIAVGDIGFKPNSVESFYTKLGYIDPGVCLRKRL